MCKKYIYDLNFTEGVRFINKNDIMLYRTLLKIRYNKTPQMFAINGTYYSPRYFSELKFFNYHIFDEHPKRL